MNRQLVITELLRGKGVYLEIGVFKGYNFFPIKASKKIAVDPHFRIPWYKKLLLNIQQPHNIFKSRFFEKESDRFFDEDAARLFLHNLIDVCLVDGMHSYDVALRDVENTLMYLDKGGVIVMHDCNPVTLEQSVTFEEWKARDFSGIWNGDVWKAILHLRSLRSDVNVFVLDCDAGLGIITKGTPENMLGFKRDEIDKLTYKQFDENRKDWLNLKPPAFFFEFLKTKR